MNTHEICYRESKPRLNWLSTYRHVLNISDTNQLLFSVAKYIDWLTHITEDDTYKEAT